MKKHPSISIAIPTYNEEKNIDRCLASIFSQKYNGTLDVMVIDGGSTDRTLNKAKKYPVRILQNPLKQAEYGKKVGLLKSRGKYFMILDCDMDIVGDHWFEKMVMPLEKDLNISGTWTGFVFTKTDAPLNKYISFDCIQRDPLFVFLTPTIASRIRKVFKNYWMLQYEKNKILPAGFCLYRKSELLRTEVKTMRKYMELDVLTIYVNRGKKTFAYIPTIGIHHPFLTTLKNLTRKRVRNLETMYFNQPDKRYWTWIDWQRKTEIMKIVFWLIYCYTLVPSLLVGLYKTIKYRSLAGMYELPFNILTTNRIIGVFLTNAEGRSLLFRALPKVK